MSADVLWVFWGDDEQPCGVIRRDPSGAGVVFRYLEGTTRRISHSLPLDITGEVSGVFFEGLLPDGVERERLARRLGVSDASTFALLAAIGGDCAGALSLHAAKERPPESDEAVRPLDAALLREVEENGPLPTLVTHGLRLSLAGAQAKLAVVLFDDGTIAAPEGRRASTHILKLPNRDFRSVVDNEHFVMTLAKNAGLVVPHTQLWRLPSGAHALLVKRFDRHGRKRLQQEDFCQATGLHPARKYEADGGPSLAKIVDVLTAASNEPLDPLRLVAMQAFNIAVANNDGHAKNFALLREPYVSLAPSYDLVCTRAWPNLDKNLAISVGGIKDAGNVGPRAWATFADAARLARKAVVRTAQDVTERVHSVIDATRDEVLANGADKRAITNVTLHVKEHCKRALHLHEAERPEPRATPRGRRK